MDDILGIGASIDIQDAERALNIFIEQLDKIGVVSSSTRNKLTQAFAELGKASQNEIAGKTANALEVMRKAIDEANSAISTMPGKMSEAQKSVENIEKVCAKLDDQLHKLEKKRELVPTDGKGFKELTAKIVGLRSQLTENNASLKTARDEAYTLSQSYEQAKKSLAGLEEMQAKIQNGTLSKSDISSMLDNLKQGANQATIEVDKLSASSERASLSLGKLLGTFGGVLAIKQLGSEIIRVRSEFQQADVAIQTMLGNKQKADALLSEVRKYAQISPLEFGDITRATQMMLGFNIEAEKVPEYIRAIGDISMGESEKFKSLTLSFSQMSATGKLMGQDLMQMINAGFNPLQVMAEQTGKSIEQLKKEMSDGAISAEMVQDAFIKATSAGGRFYKMSENASKTINGQLSMMQDAIDSAMNNIGSASESIIVSGLSGITSLIENYEKVGRVLEGLVITYGAYRTAVALVTFAQNGHTLAMTLARAQILLTQKAQALLNATMLANPYVLAATALGTLIGTLIATSDGLTGAERAQRTFNATLEEATEKQKKYREETENAIETANNDKMATDERREAMNLLIARYPDIIQKYIDETGHLKDILQLKKEIAAIDGQTTVEELNKKSLNYAYNASVMRRSVNAQLSAGRKLSERDRAEVQRIKDLYFKETGGNWWDKATTSNREIMEYFEKQSRLNQNQAQRAHTSNSIAAFQDALAGMDKNKLAIVQEQIQRGYVGRLYPELKGANLTKEDLGGLSTYVSGLLQAKQNAKVDKRALEKQKEEAQNALEALSVEAATSEEGLKLRQRISAIDKQLEAYSTSYDKSKDKGNEKYDPHKLAELRSSQDITRQRSAIDLSFSTREAEIRKQADGTDKMLAQIELDKDREIEAIRRSYEDMRLARIDEAKKLWDANPKNKGRDFYQSDAFKMANVNTRAEDKNKTAREEAALRDYEDKRKEVEERLIQQYQSYTDERLAIDKKYRDDAKSIYAAIAVAEQRGDTERVEALRRSLTEAAKVRNEAQSSLSLRQLKESPEYIRAFEDLKNTSSETLSFLISEFERTKESAAKNMSPDQLREYTATIQQMKDVLDERNPFAALSEALNELKAAQSGVGTAQKQVDAIKKGQQIIKSISIDKETGKLVATYLTEAEAIERLRAAKDREAKATNNYSKALKASLSGVNKLAEAISGLGNAIGGTEGEILGAVAGVMSFTTQTIEGIQQLAEISAMSISSTLKAIESASVILTIISAAIQLFQKISSLYKDAHAQYEEFAEKQKEINKLTDAVNDYRLAVMKAQQEESKWFSSTGLQDLSDQWQLSSEALKQYLSKMYEAQAIYQNESGGGWLTGAFKWIVGAISDIVSIPGKLITGALDKMGILDKDTVLGQILDWGITGLMTGGAGLGFKGLDAYFDSLNYEEGTTAAFKNLRIETREKSSGFLGTGIGGHSQRTEDLVEWVKANLGEDLFGSDGFINVELANTVLDKYGDKLVGETKATLEELIRLKEEYDKFNEQLQEYISEMYSPLVDNLTDALWDWLKDGKDVMDSFKKYASDTFADIAKEMVKQMIVTTIFKPLENELTKLYETYAFTQGTEAEMTMKDLADGMMMATDRFLSNAEGAMPDIQNLLQYIDEKFKERGFDITGSDSEVYQQQGSSGAWQSLGEDTGRELDGRFTALQITGESILVQVIEQTNILVAIQQDITTTRIAIVDINANVGRLIESQNTANGHLEAISRNTHLLYETNEKLTNIERSLKH